MKKEGEEGKTEMRKKVKPHKCNYAKSKENELTSPWSILGEKRSQDWVSLSHPSKRMPGLWEQLQSVILGRPLPWRQQKPQLPRSTSIKARLLILYNQNLDYTQRLKRREKMINRSFLEPNVYLSVKFSITSSISGNRGPYFQSLISTGSVRVSHPKRSDFLNSQNKESL